MNYLLIGKETDRLRFAEADSIQFNLWLPFFEDSTSFRYWDAVLEHPTIECRKWYEKQKHRYDNNLGGMNALMEKASGNLVGYAGLLVQTVDEITELEVGYSLLPQFRENGFATEAAKRCRDFAFENSLTDSVISIISIRNKPSENVARKNGMKLEKQSVYHDNAVNIFRITKAEWNTEKALPS